ncbi:TRAP transporter, 4TM/12TM fusion protein [uncultured spirochete]|jgi:TRAP transporter 4TM/12TM fusion protein|uniref:TRAP transporter, 4TM/12TM fusion protein n=1 Tax=uncultured spirochete TaxID=156406 RepID=A0A3P3XIH8_9SPIR|nr:TRAP transporter fused permease subunit [Rectinema subterraneum]SLM12825.1 TRAP transporter, 4TM/12TM fusion protein [uncultured spirochete]
MRKLDGKVKIAIYVYIIAVGVFHLYTSIFGNFEAYLQRALHLSMVLPLVFVLYPISKKLKDSAVPFYDWVLAGLSFLPGAYIAANYWAISTRIVQVDPITTTQLVLGILLVVLLLEATRRIVGMPLTIIALVFLLYMGVAAKIPGLFQGISFSVPEIVEEVFLTDEGIFSSPLGVSATYVMIFLIFGGFLEKSGVGDFFMRFAQAFTGTQPGGPALIAVTSSCLFGSISGSAVANVYGTGTFTIPLMKKIGYPSFFAGAVEAVASTGGQLMPPVMGAGAFLMASFLGLPYRTVMIAAIIPALMYYGAVFLMVRLSAHKYGLKGLSAEELPKKKDVLKDSYMVIPLVGLVYFLLAGATPMRAAVFGIVLAWLVSFFKPKSQNQAKRRLSIIIGAVISVLITVAFVFPRFVEPIIKGNIGLWILVAGFVAATFLNDGMKPKDVLDAIYSGTSGIPLVAIACATAGIVLGSVALTGIGGKLVGFVLSFAKDYRFLGLLLIMAISILLGMGLPTTGAYILASALGAPILVKMGIPPLSAHMFVFYFAVISNITPPVALAAFAAASISGANPNKIGFQAMRLGFLAFVVPFAFCYDQGLLLQASPIANVLAVATGIISVLAFGYFWVGYIKHPIPLWMRAILLVAGVMALAPQVLYVAISAGLVIVCYILSASGKVVAVHQKAAVLKE